MLGVVYVVSPLCNMTCLMKEMMGYTNTRPQVCQERVYHVSCIE